MANLPWGENVAERFHQDNENILRRLAEGLSSGTECAFITKTPLNSRLLLECGFTQWHSISIAKGGHSNRNSCSNSNSKRTDFNDDDDDDDKDHTSNNNINRKEAYFDSKKPTMTCSISFLTKD